MGKKISYEGDATTLDEAKQKAGNSGKCLIGEEQIQYDSSEIIKALTENGKQVAWVDAQKIEGQYIFGNGNTIESSMWYDKLRGNSASDFVEVNRLGKLTNSTMYTDRAVLVTDCPRSTQCHPYVMSRNNRIHCLTLSDSRCEESERCYFEPAEESNS